MMALSLLRRSQCALAKHRLRLHKVTDVMIFFSNEHLAKDVKNLDLDNIVILVLTELPGPADWKLTN